MRGLCPKCGGKGNRPRTIEEDGTEADPDMHPFLAREPKQCERCLGAKTVELTPEERAKAAGETG